MRSFKLYWVTLQPMGYMLYIMNVMSLIALLIVVGATEINVIMTSVASTLIALSVAAIQFVTYKIRMTYNSRDVRRWFGYHSRDHAFHPIRDKYFEEYIDTFLVTMRKYIIIRYGLQAAPLWNVGEARRLLQRFGTRDENTSLDIYCNHLFPILNKLMNEEDFPCQSALKAELIRTTRFMQFLIDNKEFGLPLTPALTHYIYELL